MASALLEELKTVATEVKKGQIEDAVGSSWAALAVEEDSRGRGRESLLVKAGAGGGGGRGGRDGRGWKRGGVRGGKRGAGGKARSGGAGVLNSENNGKIRWQPSLKGRMISARPTARSEECACELCPVSNQSSRAPSTRTAGRNSCKISKTWKLRQ